MNTLRILSTVTVIFSALVIGNTTYAKGRGDGPVIFVTSQGLYFDSIVVADPLPQEGRFQELTTGMNGLETELGPGDVGFLGGRWWIDLNQNGVMDEGDKYFLCPLLGPGRESP